MFISTDTVYFWMQEYCQKVNKQNKVKALDLELTIARQEILLEGRKSIHAFLPSNIHVSHP